MADNILLSLGLKTTSFQQGLNQAATAAGTAAGKIASKFDFKSVGTTLATALGLNLQNIAENVARFVTGMSKETEALYEKNNALGNQIAAKNRENNLANLTEEQKYQLALRARANLEAAMAANQQRTLAEEVRMKEDLLAYETLRGDIEKHERALKAEDRKAESAWLEDIAKKETARRDEEGKRRQQAYDQQQEANEARSKFVEENRELLLLEAKAAQGLTTEESARLAVLKLSTRELDLQSQITSLLSLTKRTPEEEALLQILIAQAAALGVQIELKEKLVSKTIEAQKRNIPLTDEMRAQQASLEAQNVAQGIRNLLLEDELIIQGKIYGASRDVRDIQRASDEELKELIRRNEAEIREIDDKKVWGPTAGVDAVNGFIVQEAAIARLMTDIQRAQYQLDERNKGRQDFSFGGIETARSRYQGDPLQFDEYIDKITRAQDRTDETNQHLRDLVGQLRNKSGQQNLSDDLRKLTDATKAIADQLPRLGLSIGG